MGVEIGGLLGGIALDEIKIVKAEKTRRITFKEQLNSVDMRNSLKMNALCKRMLIYRFVKMKNGADKIIKMINKQLGK